MDNNIYEEEIKQLREHVIEAVAGSMGLYGITLSNAHLYGILLFSEKPMTLDEMVKELNMSKTSMSTGVRSLMHLRMVNKVWKRGDRKDHYEVERDWHQNFVDYFDIEWRDAAKNCIIIMKKALDRLNVLKQQNLTEEIINIINNDIRTINNALDYYDWVLRLIDFLKSDEIFKYVPKQRE